MLPLMPKVLDYKVIEEICDDVALYACFMMNRHKYDSDIDALHNQKVREHFRKQEVLLLEEAKRVLAEARQHFMRSRCDTDEEITWFWSNAAERVATTFDVSLVGKVGLQTDIERKYKLLPDGKWMQVFE